MSERDLVSAVGQWWQHEHPEDFGSLATGAIEVEVPYSNTPRAKLDLLLRSESPAGPVPTWAVEVKHIALVGNNGKNNDFNVAKILSPYLKDRSLMHDIQRLKTDPFCSRQAVIGYCFDYSFETVAEARKIFENEQETLDNIFEVCKKVDAKSGRYSVLDLVDFADDIFVSRDLVKPAQTLSFGPTWRHPAGGYGWLFGWEIK